MAQDKTRTWTGNGSVDFSFEIRSETEEEVHDLIEDGVYADTSTTLNDLTVDSSYTTVDDVEAEEPCYVPECDGERGHTRYGEPYECPVCEDHKGLILDADLSEKAPDEGVIMLCDEICLREYNLRQHNKGAELPNG